MHAWSLCVACVNTEWHLPRGLSKQPPPLAQKTSPPCNKADLKYLFIHSFFYIHSLRPPVNSSAVLHHVLSSSWKSPRVTTQAQRCWEERTMCCKHTTALCLLQKPLETPSSLHQASLKLLFHACSSLLHSTATLFTTFPWFVPLFPSAFDRFKCFTPRRLQSWISYRVTW